MQEWFNWHAWKACVPQKGTEGSNPSLSANSFYKSYICTNLYESLTYKRKYLTLNNKVKQTNNTMKKLFALIAVFGMLFMGASIFAQDGTTEAPAAEEVAVQEVTVPAATTDAE